MSQTIKLDKNEIDYCLIPTYNSLIGIIYEIDTSKYRVLGSIDHKIILSIYSNNSSVNYTNVKTIYIQEIVHREVIEFMTNKIRRDVKIEICKTTEDSCIKCIFDKTSMTIASTNNKCECVSENFKYYIHNYSKYAHQNYLYNQYVFSNINTYQLNLNYLS